MTVENYTAISEGNKSLTYEGLLKVLESLGIDEPVVPFRLVAYDGFSRWRRVGRWGWVPRWLLWLWPLTKLEPALFVIEVPRSMFGKASTRFVVGHSGACGE